MGADQLRPALWEDWTDARAAALAAARHVAKAGRAAVAERGIFTLALSGGSTPKRFFQALAALPPEAAVPWDKTHVFWADERLVEADDERSNYGLAKRLLLAPLSLAAENIHRVRAELGLDAAVADYEAQLARVLGPTLCGTALCGTAFGNAGRGLDLVHLGLGPDGHVASLFPGSAALEARSRCAESCRVLGVERPGLEPLVPRVSLSLEALASAGQLLFLVAGADKRALARRVLNAQGPDAALPAALLLQARTESGREARQDLWVASP